MLYRRVLTACRTTMTAPMTTATALTTAMAMHERGAVAPAVTECEGAASACHRHTKWGAPPPPPADAPAAAAARRRGAMVATAAERRGGKRTADQATAHEQLQLRINKMRYSLPFVSQSALGAVMGLSAREDLPVGDRKAVRESRDAAVRQRTEYGVIHKTITVEVEGGTTIDLEIQNPQAMLAHMIKSCPSFCRRVEAAYARRPPSRQEPWTIIMYTDEVLPGNALAHTTNRKCWGVYWSLLELGPCTLSNEDPPMGARPSLHRWIRCSIYTDG